MLSILFTRLLLQQFLLDKSFESHQITKKKLNGSNFLESYIDGRLSL